MSALVLAASAPSTPDRNTEYSRNVANDVFVATPEMPEMDTCAPRCPLRKSKFRKTGAPSRPTPSGTGCSIRSKYSARARSSPAARCTSAPGVGGTYSSGSTRVVVISAASCTCAGSVPSAIANTSDSNCAPSCRARTAVTTPEIVTGSRSGSSRVVTTTSSSCRYAPGVTATQNCNGVASAVPSTRPTAEPAAGGSAGGTGRGREPSGEGLMPGIVLHTYDARHCGSPVGPSSPSAKQTNGHRSPAYVPEQHGILGIQDVGEAEVPDLGRWPGRDPAGARPGEQRRHRQAYLVHEVGGGQRAHQVRPALGQDPRHPARLEPGHRRPEVHLVVAVDQHVGDRGQRPAQVRGCGGAGQDHRTDRGLGEGQVGRVQVEPARGDDQPGVRVQPPPGTPGAPGPVQPDRPVPLLPQCPGAHQ